MSARGAFDTDLMCNAIDAHRFTDDTIAFWSLALTLFLTLALSLALSLSLFPGTVFSG